ncbi:MULTISPECIES: MarR family winged helix-turn-helix transcriptional regulator [Amycolatopsis]|uniref:DNA-binding transcriptional regulator, MarR family n=2 Tax=Amycolatopsis rubida TaxID=112413 RepID=A0A1I5EHR9_9PSEU|nr:MULTISPECIES: MarR family transcriptional regulator [Amycolatopsis]OAP24600.1 transcriptional repressor MprA [Amycolatopsis sp. M39]SFO11037.1 DNA-binding transcriptional regulator, MarR family [Amycolatopsis rubida]
MDENQAVLANVDETTFAVRGVIEASRDLMARMAKSVEMNANDLTAIAILNHHGPMGPVELGRRLGISGPSATTLVDRMEEAGYLARVRSDTDRRRVAVTVTDSAREIAAAVWRPPIEKLDAVSRTLSAAESAVVRDFLARITEAMNEGREIS